MFFRYFSVIMAFATYFLSPSGMTEELRIDWEWLDVKKDGWKLGVKVIEYADPNDAHWSVSNPPASYVTRCATTTCYLKVAVLRGANAHPGEERNIVSSSMRIMNYNPTMSYNEFKFLLNNQLPSLHTITSPYMDGWLAEYAIACFDITGNIGGALLSSVCGASAGIPQPPPPEPVPLSCSDDGAVYLQHGTVDYNQSKGHTASGIYRLTCNDDATVRVTATSVTGVNDTVVLDEQSRLTTQLKVNGNPGGGGVLLSVNKDIPMEITITSTLNEIHRHEGGFSGSGALTLIVE